VSFTTANSDTVTGDYDFVYREYSTQGRWPSPDPAGLTAENPANPQSWNRYAYVLNNPLSLTDPLGLDTCYFEDGSSYTCDPAFEASYAGPGPTYNQQISQVNSWMSAHTGIYDPNTGSVIPGTGFVWSSCTPASGLSQSCSPGYKGGGEINQGFKYEVGALITDWREQLRKDSDLSTGDDPVLVGLKGALIAFDQNVLKDLKWWQSAGANTGPSVPQPSVSCTTAIGSVMSQWSKQLQAWISAHPGQIPPPDIATPPNLTGVC
jgi:RHS repeat-associated protein